MSGRQNNSGGRSFQTRNGNRGGGGRGRGGRGRWQQQQQQQQQQNRQNARGGMGGSQSAPGSRSSSTTKHGQRGNNSNNASRNSTPGTKRNGEKGAEAHTVSELDRIRFTKMLVDMREDVDVDRIEMPSDLTNTERKFIHQLAPQLGLMSKSSGRGDDRRIAITKLTEEKTLAGVGKNRGKNGRKGRGRGDEDDEVEDDSYLPELDIGNQGISALLSHVKRFPPSAIEEAESYSTGSSLVNIIAGGGGGANRVVSSVGISLEEHDSEGILFGHDRHQKLNKDDDDDDDDNAGDEILLIDALNELNIKSSSKVKTRKAIPKHINLKKRASIHNAAQQKKLNHKNYQQMHAMRAKLPAYTYQEEICNVIRSNKVTILSGDTGCGKSTQVPQFLLDDPLIGPTANIVVTQPRRISAISIAERVASERCEEVGTTVGYNVRLEGSSSNATQLLFVTPGVLLRRFQSNPDLDEFTHVIIDEIHERDKYTEFLMIALRELLSRRDDLHIVLMSATIQTNELMEYWNGAGSLNQSQSDQNLRGDDQLVMDGNDDGNSMPAEVNIPGRAFPVQEFFLEEVLTMTGFVDDDSQFHAGGDNGMSRLDLDLENLLQQRYDSVQKRGKGESKSYKKKKKSQPAQMNGGNSLVCIMCNRSGFRCPEELGSHVAFCDGGGKCSMAKLEEKVRAIDTPTNIWYDGRNMTEDNLDVNEVEDDTIFEEYEEDIDDDDDPGVVMGKWDGESPFAVADVLSGNKTTLTEEEVLSRYQSSHDDDQIDNDLLLEVIKYIDDSSYGDGAILVFLPGWQEISELTLLLETTPPFYDKNKFSILPLHSGIPSMDQRKVFLRTPIGIRKIVLSTNIAEASVTIDDVAFVVDTGRAKEKNYDPHLKISTLQPVWISQASAKQRKGRAGRTKPGVCFHLFSRRRHESFRPFLESELLRTPLEEMCLQCKKLDLAPGGPEDNDGIPAFLAAALTPPHPKSVSNALDLLVEIGAMEVETNDLTDLGQCLSVLSLEPRVGKMTIWSYILGCSKAACSMAVAMSYKSPFIIPPLAMRSKADQAKIFISEGSESDQITILNVLKARDYFYKQGKKSAFHDYCRTNFINFSTIQMIADLRKNIARELSSLGFPDPGNDLNGWHNRNSKDSNLTFLQASIAAGLYPNVASRTTGDHNFSTMTNRKAKVHVSSLNSCRGQRLGMKCQMNKGKIEFIAYGEMVRGMSSFTMSQTTYLASTLPLILLCGNLRVRPAIIESEDNHLMSVLSVDDWIVFLCEREIASAIVVLRRRLNGSFWNMVSNPSAGMNSFSAAEKDAVNILSFVLNSAFKASPPR